MKDALDIYFDADWREFAKRWRQKVKVSNDRMFRVLERLKGPDAVLQLQHYLAALKVKHAMLKLTRKPPGTRVTDHRFAKGAKVWVQPGEDALGQYGQYSLKITSDRWITFTKYFTYK